jgi:predicted dehydrogenase
MTNSPRREFLKQSTLAAAALGVPARVSANDKINIALIGAGGRGNTLLGFYGKRPDVNIAYVCDVNPQKFDAAVKNVESTKGKAPRTEQDFRRVLDDKSIDAVVISTPLHWHALATVWACQAGKDVYCEKPASHNIWEGRKMIEAARKYKRVVQVGLQNRNCGHGWSARDYIKAGGLGEVHFVRVNHHVTRKRIMPTPNAIMPEGLNWDMYLGPAPMRAYDPMYRNYLFWDLDGGNMADDGIHQLDMARYVLDLGFPKAVQHTGGMYHFKDAGQTQDTMMVAFEYDNLALMFESLWWSPYMDKTPETIRNGGPDVFPDWYPFNGSKIEIYGSEGLMLLGRQGGGWQAFDSKRKLVKKDKMTHLATQMAHVGDFIDCIRSRATPKCDIAIGHETTTMCHMANISFRTGNRRLVYDPKTETFPGDAEANKLLNRTWRKPWTMPEKV